MSEPRHKPHPPPLPEWPEYVKEIYARGCVRIDELRKQIGADGVVPIPFRCYGCDESRSDFEMMTGDGCPLCARCFNGTVAGVSSRTAPASE